MFITPTHAQEITVPASDAGAIPAAPDPAQAVMWNIGFVALVVFSFYLLLIRPQQKRFKDHADMLGGLKKGDKVITGGGLVGKIDKLQGDKEAVIDLGSGVKVTALRSTIQNTTDITVKPSNDTKKPAAKAAKKKPAAKKTTKTKAPAKK